MFSKKCGKKKYGLCVILTIGALAAVGAMNVTRCGKNAVNTMITKMKSIFNEAKDSMCPTNCEN